MFGPKVEHPNYAHQPADAAGATPGLIEQGIDSGRYRDADQARLMLFAEHFGIFDDAKPDESDDGFVSRGDLEYVRDHPDAFGEDVSELAGDLLENLGDRFPEFPDETINGAQVAEQVALQTPPPTASTAQAEDFLQLQVGTIGQATLRFSGQEQTEAWLHAVFAHAGPIDADQAVALVQALDAQGVPAGVLLTTLEHVTRDLDGAQLNATLQQLQPQVESLARQLHDGDPGAWNMDLLDRFYASAQDWYARSGGAGQDVVVGAIAKAYPDYDRSEYLSGLYAPQDGVPDYAFNSALIAALDASGNADAVALLRTALIEHVSDVSRTATEARTTLAEHEAMLASDLAAFGPAMTDAEREAYTDAFWARTDHASARDAAAQADAQLAETLAATSADLECAAVAGDADAVRVLNDGYGALAQSPEHAQQVIDFLERVFDTQAPALFEAMHGTLGDGFADGLLTTAMSSQQAALLVAAAGEDSSDSAIQALIGRMQDQMAFFKEAKDTYGAFNKAFKVPGALDDAWEGLQKLGEYLALDPVAGSAQRAEIVAEFDKRFENLPGPFKGLLAVAGIVAAGKNLETDPSWQNFLELSKASVEGTATVMGVFAKAGKLVGVEDAAKFARFAERFAIGISLVLNVADFVDQLDELDNPGEVLKLAGIGVNVVGDLAYFIPFAGPPLKAALTGIGTALMLIGDVVSGIFRGNEERDAVNAERLELLEAAGIGATQRENMVANPMLYSALGTLGMDPRQANAAASRIIASNDFRTNDLGPWYPTLMIIASYGLQGPDALQAIDMMMDLFDSGDSNLFADAFSAGIPIGFTTESLDFSEMSELSDARLGEFTAQVRAGWESALPEIRERLGTNPDPDPLMDFFTSGQGEPTVDFFVNFALLSSGER